MANATEIYTILVQTTGASADVRNLVKELNAANKSMRETQQAAGTAARNTQRYGDAVGAVSKSTKSLNRELQNAGYQVTDFFTQIAGGVHWTRALGQQLPQLVGGMGLLGAAIGTAVAASTFIVPLLFDTSDASKELDKSLEATTDRVSALTDAIKAANRPLSDYDTFTLEAARNLRELSKAQRELAIAQQTLELLGTQDARDKVLEDLQETIDKIGALAAAGESAGGDTLLRLMGSEAKRLSKELGLTSSQAFILGERFDAISDSLSSGAYNDVAQLTEETRHWVAQLSEGEDKIEEQHRWIIEVLEQMLAVAVQSERAKDNLDELNRSTGAAAGQMDHLANAAAIAATNAARIASAIAQVNSQAASLDLSTAGLDAQTDALERGASAIEARAEGQKKMLELQLATDLEGAQTISQINAASAAYERQVASIDANARAQQRQLDVTEKLNAANKPASSSGGGGGGAARAASREMADYTRELNSFLSSLQSYETEAQKAARVSDELAKKFAAFEGELSRDQIKLYNQAMAELSAQMQETATELNEVGSIIQDSFTGLFDDLIDGTKSASEAFNDMLVSMLNSISSFLFQQQVQNFLGLLSQQSGFGWMTTQSAFSAANANAAPFAATPFAAARSPAAVTPLTGVHTTGPKMSYVNPPQPIPLAHAGSRAAQQGNTTVNVYGAPAGTEVEETISPSGEKQIDIYVKQAVKGMIGDGSLDKQMRTSYGIRRRAG